MKYLLNCHKIGNEQEILLKNIKKRNLNNSF